MAWNISPGEDILRTELHREYGGSRQGGISPSRQSPNVMVFTDPRTGGQFGYIYDGWDDHDPTLFRYTGEGQIGHQRMAGGNRAILDHAAEGRALRVFKGVRGRVRYLDEFRLDPEPYETRRAPSVSGGPERDVLVFRMRRLDASTERRSVRPRDAVYRRSVPSPTQPSDQPFSKDPNAIDRALRAHADVQNGLSDFLVANGAATWSPRLDEPDFDLAWVLRGVPFVAEVKSLTALNEDGQLRLGLGQVLDYQELMLRKFGKVRAVLAVEGQPADPRWLALCERHAVTLVWPATFDVLLDAKLTAVL